MEKFKVIARRRGEGEHGFELRLTTSFHMRDSGVDPGHYMNEVAIITIAPV